MVKAKFCNLYSFALGVLLLYSGYVFSKEVPACPSSLNIFPCSCIENWDKHINLFCDNVNLATVALPLKGLPQNTIIDELIITESNIVRLYGTLFLNLPISKLSVIYSKIAQVDTDILSSLTESLQELSFEGNFLNSLPLTALDHLSNLTSLNLARNKFTHIPAKSFDKLTTLVELNLGGNELKSIHIQAFVGLSSLEKLHLNNNLLEKIDKGVFKITKKLKYLDISENSFSVLDKQQFNDLTSLVTLNISKNQFSKLPQSIFSRNAQLLSLNLSYNSFQELDTYLLRGLRFLKELYIQGNNITSIARRAFGSTARLRKFDASYNSLTEISTSMFSNMQFLGLLNISYNNISTIKTGAFERMYQVDIDLSHNQLSLIEDRAFIEVSNITKLDLSHNKLSFLPPNTFETSDVTQLYLNNNNFTNATLIPLENLVSIKYLNLTRNSLTQIDRKSFTQKKLYEMETIDLSYNNISDMSGSTFEKFWALRFLDLSHNKIRKIGFGAFGNLPTLLMLDLSDNEIKDINGGGVSKLISLKTLCLSRNHLRKLFQIPLALNELLLDGNAIVELADGSFPMINSLLSVNLDRNGLSGVGGKAFQSLLTLRSLSLASNNFTTLTSLGPALRELSSLQYLNLSNNRIERLETRAFGNLPVVFQLNLDANNLTEISPNAFDGLLQLINLTISHNSLEKIHAEAFKGLVSLQWLDLSHNKLIRLENKTNSILEDLLSLERLTLSHNRISFLGPKSFPSSPYVPYKLKEIDLSNNLVETLFTSVGLASVHDMTLAHNSLRQIEPYVLANMSSLRALDLSNNHLEELNAPGTFSSGDKSAPLPYLIDLNLANNELSEIPIQELTALKNLSSLDLRGNQLNDLTDELSVLVKRNTLINLSGNPFLCNCDLRRKIDRIRVNQKAGLYLKAEQLQQRQEAARRNSSSNNNSGSSGSKKSKSSSSLELPDEWDSLVCNEPDNLQGRVITELMGKELDCPSDQMESNLAADVIFRGSHWPKRDALRVVWLVRNRLDDIAAFKLTLSNLGDDPSTSFINEQILHYDNRQFLFEGLNSRKPYRVCISSLNSQEKLLEKSVAFCTTAAARTL